jgi:GC-rich sequence DNA-binding factor
MGTPKFDPEAIPARRRFLRRRTKLLNNLVHWQTYTGGQFGLGPLAERVVNNCMLPVAESGWEVGGKEEMQKVLHSDIDIQALVDNIRSRSPSCCHLK